MSDKQLVIDTVQKLSETATLDEISERVAILAAIRRGEHAAAEGRIVTQEEIRRRSETWTSK